jgi:hypothetical protein
MFNRKNLLPALALAVSLAPLAAHARTGDVSHNQAVQQSAQPIAGAQVTSASPGRPGEFNRPAGYFLSAAAPQYAASGAQTQGTGSL